MHVLATLQALPDAPASLFAPPPDRTAASPTGGNWITTTPDGYFEGSAHLAPFIRWSVDGVPYPASASGDVYYRPDLVQQALKIPRGERAVRIYQVKGKPRIAPGWSANLQLCQSGEIVVAWPAWTALIVHDLGEGLPRHRLQ